MRKKNLNIILGEKKKIKQFIKLRYIIYIKMIVIHNNKTY